MASRKKKPAVPTEDMSEEEIQIYIDSMPQQSKIMMHRNLAQWRNMTGMEKRKMNSRVDVDILTFTSVL